MAQGTITPVEARDEPPVCDPRTLTCDVVTSEGLRYSVRPIRPDDAARLVAFHSRLSSRTCYLRFFSFHPVLTASEVERFTHVDYVDRLALVAVIDDRIIGVGRYDRKPGTDEAEVAFVIADEYQHHGIGSLLLDELVAAARVRGIEVFLADTLCENRTMLGVFLHSGFAVSRETEYGTVYLRFPIAQTLASQQAEAERNSSRNITRPAART